MNYKAAKQTLTCELQLKMMLYSLTAGAKTWQATIRLKLYDFNKLYVVKKNSVNFLFIVERDLHSTTVYDTMWLKILHQKYLFHQNMKFKV